MYTLVCVCVLARAQALSLSISLQYFDGGASKHITSQQDMLSSLKSTHAGNVVKCANNSSYLVKGVGSIVLVSTNGSTFTLLDALYVPGIKKNLL